jgi:micrococcal nuclease
MFKPLVLSLLLSLPVLADEPDEPVSCPKSYYEVKEVTKVYDGDTITVLIDLGFSIYTKQVIRLYGINTPELRGNSKLDGLVSRDYLKSTLNNSNVIIIKTYKDDKKGKYGRYLGTVFTKTTNGCININELLVSKGLAVRYYP